MRLLETDAIEQVKRLVSAGYTLGRGASVEGVARLWSETLEVTPPELREAVSAYVRKGGRYFPRPGDLVEFVAERRGERGGEAPTGLRSRYLAWEQNQEGGCPVCGAVIQMVTAEQRGGTSIGPPRLGVHHDFRLHQEKRVPHVGWPYPRIPAKDADDVEQRGAALRKASGS